MTEYKRENSDKGFDSEGFFRTLEATVKLRTLNWKQVSTATGVSTSTLNRMAQGKRPDAGSLAALAAWAGINTADFVNAPFRGARAESLTQISSVLQTDPNLDPEAAKSIEDLIRVAYENLRKPKDNV